MLRTFKLAIKITAIVALALLIYLVAERLYTHYKNWKTADLVPVVKQNYRYGIPVDSFLVFNGTVLKNQFVSDILLAQGVGMGTIDLLARKSVTVFDVRKIRTDKSYTVFRTKDSTRQAKYFVYEINPVDYVVYELFDSLCIYKASKVVENKIRSAQGVIESSLWNTMEDNNLDPNLALKLSDIYAWTIDFYGLQKGDRFRAVFSEMFVDSVSVGIGKIYAAEFEHNGKSKLGFMFTQKDTVGYYSEKGENLQGEFLKAPLAFSRISSHFSGARLHPVLRIVRPHHGVDYAAPKGTPVMSIGEGTVISKGYSGGAGNQVKIRHNSIYTTQYMHLSGYGTGIFEGARVRQGQVIGFVGSTGLSSGPHLDFRVYKGGSPINPLTMESKPAKPIDAVNLPQFTVYKDSLLHILQNNKWNLLKPVH